MKTMNTVVKEESFTCEEESKQQIHALNEQLSRLGSTSRGRNGAFSPDLMIQAGKTTPIEREQLITIVPFISAVKPEPKPITLIQTPGLRKQTHVVFAPSRAKSSEKPRVTRGTNQTMMKRYAQAQHRSRGPNPNSSVTYDEDQFANISASLHNNLSSLPRDSMLLDREEDLDERHDARTHQRSQTALEMLNQCQSKCKKFLCYY